MLFSIQAKADKKSVGIDIFDVIGESFFGEAVSAKQVRAQLKAAKGADVTLRINSRGGDVLDGLAIYNALREHDGTVTARVMGVAASMASVIAMAADELVMPKHSFLMIHRPTGYTGGNADELKSASDAVRAMENVLVDAYAEKTRMPKAQIEGMMAKETWISAKQAVRMGFADRIDDSADDDKRLRAEASADWESAPEAVRNIVRGTTCATVSEEDEMNEEQLNKLLSALAPLADFGKRLEAIDARLPAAPKDISEPAEKPEEKPAPVEDKLTAALAKIDRLAAALAAGAVSREGSEEVAAPKAKGEQKFTAQQIKLAKENGWKLEELFADD